MWLRDVDYIAWSYTGNAGELKFEPKCPDPKDEQNPNSPQSPSEGSSELSPTSMLQATVPEPLGHGSTEALWDYKSQ